MIAAIPENLNRKQSSSELYVVSYRTLMTGGGLSFTDARRPSYHLVPTLRRTSREGYAKFVQQDVRAALVVSENILQMSS